MSPATVVVGGGLAGITAALRCRDAGCEVTLLEARPRLGGATSSFRRGGLSVDTGQHVFLRCYTAYRALLGRLGMTRHVHVQRRFAVPLLRPDGARTVLRRTGLPAPAHLAPALLGHRLLRPAQRLAAARTGLALRRLDPDDPALDAMSFGQWLAGRREPAEVIEALWGLFTVAALNAAPADASLALAVKVFRTGLLDDAEAGDLGVPLLPLGELHGEAAQRALTAAGASVRLRTRATGLRRTGDGYLVVVAGGAAVAADAVVVAVPHQAAAALLDGLDLPGVASWAALGASPIVNAHVVFDRPVTDLPFAGVVGSPLQWIFDRTAVAGAPSGQYLAVSLSAAAAELAERTGALLATLLPALCGLFPGAAQAEVTDSFVTREPRATFRQAPGTRRLRPPAGTALPGLALAGAWTDTGWPDTMEGAVRSGESAAAAVLGTAAGRSGRPVEVTA